MEPPRFNPPTTTCPPLIPFCRSELQRAIITPTPTALPLLAVESKQLDGKFMLARITVADQQLGPRVKILLRALDAFLERRRRGLIQDAVRLRGDNGLARQQQFQRAPAPHQARQTLRAAISRYDAEFHFRLPQSGI